VSEHEEAVLALRDTRDRMLYGSDYKALGYALERLEAYPELLEACKVFAEWLRREDEGPQYPAGADRDSPGGHEIWHAWYYGNLDLCDRAQVLARAAIAKAEGREP